MKKLLFKFLSRIKDSLALVKVTNLLIFKMNKFSTGNGRDEQDRKVKLYLEKMQNMKLNGKSVSAIYRIKNGAEYMEASILSVVPLVSEIIIVDNMSTDNTLDIAYKLKEELNALVEIKVFNYNKKLEIAGDGYLERINGNKGGSLSEYYRYCFSLGTSDYLMKCDAHYIYIPKALLKIRKIIDNRKRFDIIQYCGIEVFGKKMGVEQFIFSKNSGYEYYDDEQYERVRFNFSCRKKEIFTPVFFHIKRLSYSKYVNRGNKKIIEIKYNGVED